MTTRRERVLIPLATAAVLLQGLLVVAMPSGPVAALAVLPAVLAVAAALGRVGGRRGAWWATAASALLVAVVLLAARHGGDPRRWAADREREASALVARRQAAALRLQAAVDSLAAHLVAAPAAAGTADLLAGLSAWWRGQEASLAPHTLGLVAWRDGQRVGWDGEVEPFPPPVAPGEEAAGLSPVVSRGIRGWYWRGFVPCADTLYEWQVRLTGTATGEQAVPLGHGAILRTDIVSGAAPRPLRWSGRPESGLRLTADVVVGHADHMAPVLLRLTVQLPSYRVAAAQRRSRLQLAAAGLYLPVVLSLWAVGRRRWHLVAGLWAVRLVWASLPLGERLLSLAPVGNPPVPPASPASLLDGTYLALRGGGGLAASALDLALTALLLAGTAVVALAGGGSDRRPDGRRRGRLVVRCVLAIVSVAALWGMARCVAAVALGANPRLIGPRVPLAYPTFWAVHLSLLLGGLGVVWLLVAAWHRWGGFARRPGWGRARWLAPLLLVVLVNHAVLERVYTRLGTRWLEARAAFIAGDRLPETRLLLADLLTELFSADVDQLASPEAHAPLASSLWRDWRAYALWRRTAIDDLGTSGRLEVLTSDGTVTSSYAKGFFRDEAYEIVRRSEWRSGDAVQPRPGRVVTPYFQRELRRYAGGEEWILRGEIARLDGDGWLSLELPYRSARVTTLAASLQPRASGSGYLPRLEIDRPLLLMRGDDSGWRDTAGDDVPAPEAEPVIAALRDGRLREARIPVRGRTYLCVWAPLPHDGELPSGTGLLLGLQLPSAGERLLDLSRLLLLDVSLLAALLLLLAPVWWRGGRLRGRIGFQERFLGILLLLGLLPLVLAGTFIDRSSRDWAASAARRETREGLATAEGQLQGLLSEQARALAGSDYISDLLRRRMVGERPLGPFTSRQAMVFTDRGELLLDETLSDLDADEAATVLETARGSALVVMREEHSAFLGTLIPVDFTWQEADHAAPGDTAGPGPVAHARDGYFFYRQRIEAGLLAGLADVVQGEAVLYLDGEAVAASHPAAVFSGSTPQILSPATVRRLLRQPGNMVLVPDPARPHGWLGMLTIPELLNTGHPPRLTRAGLPAVLTVSFPERALAVTRQRERTIMFLSGVATVIFLTAALLGLVLAWRIFNPVRVLVEATRRLAAGDFAAPLPPPGGDEIGTLSASFAAMRDRLRATQAALAARERFLARLLERVPVGVLVLDDAGRTVTVNPAARQILADCYGDPDTEEPARRLLADVTTLVPGGEGEAEWRPEGTGRILRGRIAPLERPDGRRDTLIVCEDVTEFVANKRMAVSAQLARQVAHEVKNPLTPIQLSIQFLERAYRDRAENLDEIVAGTVRQILRQVELLRSIATEFSLLGRPDDLECSSVDMAAVAGDVIARYRAPGDAGAEGLRIRWEGETPPPVLAHPESLARVLGNLMENSIQAVGDVSSLELTLRWRVTPTEVTLCWADNGPGLAPEILENLYDPYFSTKSRGTGLGLPICRNLVSRMGGRFSLDNRQDGPGAEARVTLRRADLGAGEPATEQEVP